MFQRKILKRYSYLLLGCTLYTLRCILLPRSKSIEEKSGCLSRKETESSNNTTFVTCGHHPRWGFYGSCTFSTLHNLNQRLCVTLTPTGGVASAVLHLFKVVFIHPSLFVFVNRKCNYTTISAFMYA